jgi:hypothetical protein
MDFHYGDIVNIPPPLNIVAPENNSSVSPGNVILRWEPTNDAVIEYIVRWRKINDIGNVIKWVNDNFHEIWVEPNTTYEWEVAYRTEQVISQIAYGQFTTSSP